MEETLAKSYLPTKPHLGEIKPEKLKYLLIAPPKWGKTTWATGCPNCLLLAFEEGHADVECAKIVITQWSARIVDRKPQEKDGIRYASAMEVIDALEAYNPYSMIIVDTLDMAVKMCTDYECNNAKISHPSDGGDYGKGWDLYQTTPFRKFYNRLVKLGTGVTCVSHIKEEWKKDKFGKDLYRRESSLPAGIQRFIHTQSDIIVNGKFTRRRKGQRNRDRAISFDGSDEVMAGTRIKRVYLPNEFIVAPPFKDYTAPWKQWITFFTDSPNAGIEAEKDFLTKTRGVDNENLPEQVEPTVQALPNAAQS